MKRKLNIKRLIISFILFLLVITFALFGVFFYNISAVDKKAEVIDYQVELGKSVYEIFDDLENEGIIRNSFALKLYSKIKGEASIDAGKYKISKSYNAAKIYRILSEENALSADEVRFTLLEGENVNDLIEEITKITDISEEQMKNTITDKEYINELISIYWFLTDDILKEGIYYPLEGYLFPDTYQILKTSTAKDVIEKMLEGTKNKLEPFKEEMLKNDLSIHEIMTLASLVQLEGYKTEDENAIAGVLLNRINDDWLLQSDPTTYYAIGVNPSERELNQTELDDCSNKYNTSCKNNVGLPIGPIANPGLDAIKASINPEDNDYYYFVSDKYKNVYFNKTYSEHLSTIYRLRNEGLWYEYDE